MVKRMSRTFEELAGSEMDALYQGALFLSGGDEATAERLVVDTVMLAFEEHAADVDPERTRRWFEARLVRAYLRRVQGLSMDRPPETSGGNGLDPTAFEALGPHELFSAAAALPPGPRAALWLVLLRRWSHSEAANAMQVDRDQMELMLGYRDVLMRRLMSSSGERRQRRMGRA